MPKVARVMSESEIRNWWKPGTKAVGGVPGLLLRVSKTGMRYWTLRIMVGGRRRDMGLGRYPDVTVDAARKAAAKYRDQVKRGMDPIEERRRLKDHYRERLIAHRAEAHGCKIQTSAWRGATYPRCTSSFIATSGVRDPLDLHEETLRKHKAGDQAMDVCICGITKRNHYPWTLREQHYYLMRGHRANRHCGMYRPCKTTGRARPRRYSDGLVLPGFCEACAKREGVSPGERFIAEEHLTHALYLIVQANRYKLNQLRKSK